MPIPSAGITPILREFLAAVAKDLDAALNILGREARQYKMRNCSPGDPKMNGLADARSRAVNGIRSRHASRKWDIAWTQPSVGPHPMLDGYITSLELGNCPVSSDPTGRDV